MNIIVVFVLFLFLYFFDFRCVIFFVKYRSIKFFFVNFSCAVISEKVLCTILAGGIYYA